MVLSEVTTVPDTALPLDEFRAHLRLGTGFGEDSLQDNVLLRFLRAAVAAIEGQTGKVLVTRDFDWVLSAWNDAGGQRMPVAPVSAIADFVLIDRNGAETPVEAGRYLLVQDADRPSLRPAGSAMPGIPVLGTARIRFTAGMAPHWGGLPADLGQAVLLLAAYYYEYRTDAVTDVAFMPDAVTSLLRRYKPVRLSLGAAQ